MSRLPTTEEMLQEARAGVWPSPHHEPRLHPHAVRDLLLFLCMELKRHDATIDANNSEAGDRCREALWHAEDAHGSAALMCNRQDEAEARRDAA
jgi:hypothetical protein